MPHRDVANKRHIRDFRQFFSSCRCFFCSEIFFNFFLWPWLWSMSVSAPWLLFSSGCSDDVSLLVKTEALREFLALERVPNAAGRTFGWAEGHTARLAGSSGACSCCCTRRELTKPRRQMRAGRDIGSAGSPAEAAAGCQRTTKQPDHHRLAELRWDLRRSGRQMQQLLPQPGAAARPQPCAGPLLPSCEPSIPCGSP